MSQIPENTIMNDDCVLEVFRFLNLDDLLNVCRVSIQFHRLAREIFSIKYKHLKLNTHLSRITEKKLLILFKNFGDLMQSIETPLIFYPWYRKETQKFIIMLIKNYCSKKNRKLESLKLNYFGNI